MAISQIVDLAVIKLHEADFAQKASLLSTVPLAGKNTTVTFTCAENEAVAICTALRQRGIKYTAK